MAPLRLALITPRYWPHSGELESMTAHLAEGLADEGVQVTVLTGRWGPDWPPQLVVRGIPIVRVSRAPSGGWTTFRYLTALGRWIRAHRQAIDLACAMNLRYEAYATVRALRGTNVPTVLHCREIGPGSDLWWQRHYRFGSRIKRDCERATAIVTPNRVVAADLAEAGYDPARLHVIPPGVVPRAARSADRRFRARMALAEVNGDLATAEYAPVGLYIGKLEDVAGLSHLLTEWQGVATRWPSARLWLIGDGPGRDHLCELVADLDVRYQVFLPGSFEEWSDLFQAADLFVSPLTSGRTQLLLEAMAAGLPVVAADGPDLHGMMEHGKHGLLVLAGETGAWTAAISQLFETPRLAAQLGAAARRWANEQFARQKMAAAHLDLFASLTGRRR